MSGNVLSAMVEYSFILADDTATCYSRKLLKNILQARAIQIEAHLFYAFVYEWHWQYVKNHQDKC